MEPNLLNTLSEILKTSGMAGVAALGFYLFFKERQYSQSLNAKILEQGIKQTEAAAAVNTALARISELFKDLINKLDRKD